jgi:hypothetical protein
MRTKLAVQVTDSFAETHGRQTEEFLLLDPP